MDKLDINFILGRTEIIQKIKDILTEFECNKNNLTIKKGIYIYGEPGIGKTTLITNILKELNYDIVKYDAGDIRNKMIIDNMTKHNMSDKNIMSMFHRKIQKIVIVMDEIDGMNNGDKGGINSLIKLIRPKKTKKQKLEEVSFNPIICIGNYHIDKKIKELMKACHTIELKSPSKEQMQSILSNMLPNVMLNKTLMENMVKFIQSDLRKIRIIDQIYDKRPEIFDGENKVIQQIFQIKSYNDDTKEITQKLINQYYPIEDHLTMMNETDRTIVGLLWHENIIDVLGKMKKEVSVPFYLELLDNICYADYIDRITFQKQIWQFNEMSSLIKTFKNNKLFHETFKKKPKCPSEVRFTKVLTKYSTEYNNSLFIQDLCQQMSMDTKDLFAFFWNQKDKFMGNDSGVDPDISDLVDHYDICKLDIHRIYRYLDKYTKESEEDDCVDDEDICSV